MSSALDLTGARWRVRAVGDLSDAPISVRARIAAGIPATVPGCVHTDLIDAQIIGDPAIGMNEPACAWVSLLDWRYECSFEVPASDAAPDGSRPGIAQRAILDHDEIDLCFGCLDTIATIELNGDRIGEAASEFLPWRFPVLGLLKPGTNTLAVTFKSPVRHVRDEAARLGHNPPLPVNGNWEPFVYARKCASNFEWDWGPRVATCGIAGAVRLEGWSVVRIHDLRARATELDTRFGEWAVIVECGLQWSDVARPDCAAIRLTCSHPHTAVNREDPMLGTPTNAAISLSHFYPKGWKQVGFGDQLLMPHRLEIVTNTSGLPSAAPEVFAALEWPVGFRMMEPASFYDQPDFFPLVHIDDRGGTSLFLRGINWIPEGLWPRDRTPDRVRARLLALRECNINTIRVWGGGRYEPDWFYDLCDELGIMVWQDFMFTCGMYPETEPLRSLIEAEARHHVARLSRHPSVVLWCGGNECIWAHDSWDGTGWKARLQPGQTWGRGYYLDLLPRLVGEHSGAVYWPNSPWTGMIQPAPPTPAAAPATKPDAGEPTRGAGTVSTEPWHPCNDTDRGDRHTWDVWGDGYRSMVPTFCSEFGQQSPSNWATLGKAGLLPEAAHVDAGTPRRAGTGAPSSSDLVPPALIARQRGPGGMARWFDEPMAVWFKPAHTFERWHFLAQLLQARSMAIGCEWMRAHMDRCHGALIWQGNDAWPGFSWSLIDSAGRKKLAWYAVRRAFAPRCLTIHPLGSTTMMWAINDTGEAWRGEVLCERRGFDGSLLANATVRMSVPGRTSVAIANLTDLLGAPLAPQREVLRAAVVGGSDSVVRFDRAEWFFGPDREIDLPVVDAARIEVRVRPLAAGQLAVEVASPVLIRDLCLMADVFDSAASSDSQLVTLLPGERHTFVLDGCREDITETDVRRGLRWANPGV